MTEPKVVWQWDAAWSNPEARMYMGLQARSDGTGYMRLESGDGPRYCEYCHKDVSDYPHSHTKQERDGLR